MTATARRGHGEGSVYRDAANGTRVGAISLGWRPDGSRMRRKVTGRTKTEVREKLKRLQAEADAGLKTSASYTLAKDHPRLGAYVILSLGVHHECGNAAGRLACPA